jgi:hypothetical protein
VDYMRPSFLPSAFFTSGTGLWDGRYISSSGDYLDLQNLAAPV